MSSLTGDGAPKELRDQADAEDEAESTRVDHGPSDAELNLMDDLIASHYADESDGMGTSPQTAALLNEAATETARAIRAEARSAYRRGVPDKHSPEL